MSGASADGSSGIFGRVASFWRGGASGDAAGQSCAAGAGAGAQSCPTGPGASATNPLNNIEDPKNARAPGQRIPLPTNRVRSTIPIATPEAVPEHQRGANGTWVYPSEQMFFNAMKRKGWQPREEDMPSVVAIHNTVNERAWREILAWEQMHSEECGNPKLARFLGRPNDYSPKARLLNLLGYKLPFDRHDWVVDRCGTQVRYVIDFYNATPAPGQIIGMHLDVRPALDSPGALYDRIRMQMRWVASGRWREEEGQQPAAPPGMAAAAGGPAAGGK